MTLGDIAGALFAAIVALVGLILAPAHPFWAAGVFGVSSYIEYVFGKSLGYWIGAYAASRRAGHLLQELGLADQFETAFKGSPVEKRLEEYRARRS